VESESHKQYGLLWIGLGITVVGVASYFFNDPYQKIKRLETSTHSQHQDDMLEQAQQFQELQQKQRERSRVTNWLGIAAMTTGCMLWMSSKRRIPFSLLLATGLNLLNSWQAIGIDQEAKQTTETDNNANRTADDLQTNEHARLAETGLQYH
jgi:hypothetical protein